MHPVRFIKRPNLILMKTLADEVYWRLQDFCGLLSCFVLHSCASRSTRAVPALPLHGSVGRQSSYYVLRKGSCWALELRACCVGASQCENRMEKCSPVFCKYATMIFNLSGKATQHGLSVLSKCWKPHGEALPTLWCQHGAKPKSRTSNKPSLKRPVRNP